MKTLLALILFTSAALADVMISNDGTLTKDGVGLNNAADALLNKQVTAREFQDSLKALLAKSAADLAAAQEAFTKVDAFAKALASQAETALANSDIAALHDIVKQAKAPALAAATSEAQAALDAANKAADDAQKKLDDLAAQQPAQLQNPPESTLQKALPKVNLKTIPKAQIVK